MVAIGASVGIYVAVLHLTYQHLISPENGYAGLRYRDPDTFSYAVAISLVAVVAALLPRTIRRPSDFVLWVLFVMAAAPSILLPQYADISSVAQATEIGYAVAGSLLMVRVLVTARPRNLVLHLKLTHKALWQILTVVSLLLYLLFVLSGALSLRYLNVYDVYAVREQYVSVSSGSVLLGYLLPVQFYLINPAFMGRGLFARRPRPLLFGLFGQVALYSSTGHKAILFSIPAVFATYMLFRLRPNPAGHHVLLGIGLGSAAGAAIDLSSGGTTVTSLFVRRFLVIPGAFTAAYVSIFADRQKANFADVLFFLDNPYPEGAAKVVGVLFLNSPDVNATVNLWGHGFSNYGYLGMFIEAGLLAGLLWLADAAAHDLPVPVSCVLFLMPAIAIGDTSAFTAILTHGFGAAVLLAAVAPRAGWMPQESEARAGESEPATPLLLDRQTR